MSDNEKEEVAFLEETLSQTIKEIQGKVEKFKKDTENVNLFEINEILDITSKTKWKLENVDCQLLKRSSILVYDKKLKELLKEIDSLKYMLIQKENKKEWDEVNNNSIMLDDDNFFLIPECTDVNEKSDPSTTFDSETDLSQYKLSFQNMKNQRIIKGVDQTKHSSLKLDHLTHCEVVFLNILGSVLIQKIEDCTIWLAAVESSVLIYNCKNCIILTNTKQLRIHDTVDTRFYIQTTSSPIIENSFNLTFSRYNLNYDGLSELLEKVGLTEDCDKWKGILDFSWQNAKEPSPHFRISNELQTVNVIIKTRTVCTDSDATTNSNTHPITSPITNPNINPNTNAEEAPFFSNQYIIENFPAYLKKND